MASYLKGITIEIGGDTTKLDKALKSVNTSSRALQNELKSVNRALKFDPTNVTLIKQKQDILRESIEKTKEKLQSLKSVEQQVQQQFERGEIGADQYRAFQREIENTKQRLNELNTEAKNFGTNVSPSFIAAKEHIASFGEKTTEVGKKLLPLTATISSIGVLASKIGIEFEYAMSDLQATSGATGESFEQLKAKAEELGATTCKSSTDSAQAMKYLALAGYDTNQILSATEPILKASVAWGEDMATSADLATDSMSSLGLSVDELSHYLDVCSQAQRSSNTSATQMMEAYIGCGGTLRTLGVPLEESATLLGKMADQGKKGSEAGNSLNSILVNLTGGSSTAAGALEKLGVSAWDSQGNFIGLHSMLELLQQKLSTCTQEEKTNFETAIGGKTQLDTLNMLLNGLGDGYDNLSEKINNCDGVTEEMYDTMNNNEKGNIESLKSALESLGITIYETLKPAIASITKLITKLAQGLGNLNPTTQRLIVLITAIVAAIGPTLIIVGKIATGISALMSAYIKIKEVIAGCTVVQNILNASFLGCPVTWIIAAIVALVAIFVLLWNKCDAFREFWINLWDTIKNALSNAYEVIVNFFTITIPEAFNNLKDKLVEFGDSIKNFFIELWNSIVSFFTETIPNFLNNIKQLFIDGWNSIVTFFTESIPNFISNVITFLSELPNKIAFGIGVIIGYILKFGVDVYTWVVTEIPNIINSIITFFSELPGKIWTFLVDVVNKIGQWGSNMISTATERVTTLINTTVLFFSELPGRIWTFLVDIVNKIRQWGSNMISVASERVTTLISTVIIFFSQLPSRIWNAIVGTISKISQWGSDMLSTAKRGASNVISGIVNIFSSLPGKMIDIGKNIVQGIWNGISNAKDWVLDKIKSFGSSVVDGIKSVFSIHSPSRIMKDEVGKYIAQGIGVGIEENTDDVIDKTKQLNNKIIFETNKFSQDKLTKEVDNVFSYNIDNNKSTNIIPQTAIFSLIVDGKVLGEVSAPYVDIINGGKIELTGRGLVL